MSTESTNAAPATTPPAVGFAPEAGVGTPLAVGGFGFAVLMLGFPTAGLIPAGGATVFAAVAFGTGAFGLGIGGLFELRANNVFGGSFSLLYSAFLLTTAIMLQFFADPMGPDFAPAFGTWLLIWFVFTAGMSWAAWHVNMPAFIAFVLLALAYLLLGLTQFTASTALATAGGWVLILDGIVALYLAWALAVTPLVGDRVPLWPYPYGR
jgi:uncharacterized protein